MRALSFVLVLVLVASACIAAALLLVSGRGLMYLPGAGTTRSMAGILSTCGVIAIAAFVAAGILHALAHIVPKQYFQVMWWRDLAWVVSLSGALGVVFAEIVGVATYGVL